MERPVRVVTIRVVDDVYVALRLYAHTQNRSLNGVANEALRTFLVEHIDDDVLAELESEAREARAALDRLRDALTDR